MSSNYSVQVRSSGRMLFLILCFFCFSARATDCITILSSSPHTTAFHDDQDAFTALGESLRNIISPVNDGKPTVINMIDQEIQATKTASDEVFITWTGSANSGKSTLFNMIAQTIGGSPIRELSKAGVRAGLTTRLTVGVGSNDPGQAFERDRRERLGPLQLWQNNMDATTPGKGLIVQLPNLPTGIAIIDAPDINSGSRFSAEPTNLNSALQVIYTSDVLLIIVDKKDYANRDLRVGLNTIFKKYGVKHTILIFEGKEANDSAVIAQMLKEFANEIYPKKYHNPNGGYPDPVLAAYLVPDDNDVVLGRAHPRLIPVGGSRLSIDDVIHRISYNRKHIRASSLAFTKEAIVTAAHQELTHVKQQRLAAQLYLKGVMDAIDTAASSKLLDYPYEEAKKYIRDTFVEQLSDNRQLLEKVTQVFSPEIVKNLFKVFSKGTPPEFVKTNHLEHDSFAVSQLKLQLASIQNHQLIIQSESDRALYKKTFPGEQIGDRYSLPSKELLSPEIRKSFDDMLNADSAIWSAGIGKKITERQSIHKNSEIEKLLSNLAQKRMMKITAMGLLTVASPLAGLVGMSFVGATSFTAWLAAAIGPPILLKRVQSQMIDNHLKESLNVWFKQLQIDATREYFYEALAPLMSQLSAQSALHSRDLDNAQRAIQFLSPKGESPIQTLR